MRNFKDRFLKYNHIVQATLKEFIDHFQQALSNAASTLIAIEEKIRSIKKSTELKQYIN